MACICQSVQQLINWISIIPLFLYTEVGPCLQNLYTGFGVMPVRITIKKTQKTIHHMSKMDNGSWADLPSPPTMVVKPVRKITWPTKTFPADLQQSHMNWLISSKCFPSIIQHTVKGAEKAKISKQSQEKISTSTHWSAASHPQNPLDLGALRRMSSYCVLSAPHYSSQLVLQLPKWHVHRVPHVTSLAANAQLATAKTRPMRKKSPKAIGNLASGS